MMKSFWPGGEEHEKYCKTQKQVFVVPTVFETSQCQVVGGERESEEAGERSEKFILRPLSSFWKALSLGAIH